MDRPPGRLGWSERMVRGRVAKAPSVLRRNLARRGSGALSRGAGGGPFRAVDVALSAALALGWMDAKAKAATEIASDDVP